MAKKKNNKQASPATPNKATSANTKAAPASSAPADVSAEKVEASEVVDAQAKSASIDAVEESSSAAAESPTVEKPADADSSAAIDGAAATTEEAKNTPEDANITTRQEVENEDKKADEDKPAGTVAVAAVDSSSSSAKAPQSTNATLAPSPTYTIVPTPKEETAAQKISGFYRRRERNERTEAEARAEEAHAERLASAPSAAEREVAVRSWSHAPAHLLLDVAFGNMERFNRLYIEAEYDAFTFMVATDAQRDKVAVINRLRSNRAAMDALATEEFNERVAVRKEAREGFGAVVLARDTERRALLAAEREARRRARQEAMPAPLSYEDEDSHDNYDSATIQSQPPLEGDNSKVAEEENTVEKE